MRMSHENIKSLALLINSVISSQNPDNPVQMSIGSSQYVTNYINIFFKAIEENGGEPVPYDDFGAMLWEKIGKDVNEFPNESDEFLTAWTAWVHLYRRLKEEEKLRE